MEGQKRRFITDSLKKGRYFLLIIFNLLTAILFLITPFFLKGIIGDNGIIKVSDIVYIVLIMGGAYLTQFFLVFLSNTLVRDYSVNLTGKIYEKIFNMKYDSLINEGPTSLSDRTATAVNGFSGFFMFILPQIVVNGIIIAVTLVMAWAVNPIAAILMFITLPVQYFGFRLLNKKLSVLSVELNEVSSKAFRDIISIISQTDFIKQNPYNNYLIPPIKKYTFSYQDKMKSVNYTANGASGLIVGVNQILQSLTVIYLTSIVLSKGSDFGGVMFIIMIIPFFNNSVRSLSMMNLGISNFIAAGRFLDYLEEESEDNGKLNYPENANNISMKIQEVSIDGNILLKGVDLTFYKGDVVGVMGESGSGKTSLLKLLPKFRESKGIKIGEIPLENIKNDELRSRISYYSQNPPIVTDSLINNLNFGRKPEEDSKYRELQFLNKFEDLNKMIYENGANLSGGDKQRIALSRVFTEVRDIIILDEPTNSLDPKTEKEILKEILKLGDDRIIFIVTHSDEVLKYCNRRIRVNNKRIDEIKPLEI